jgi:hypothetical protein
MLLSIHVGISAADAACVHKGGVRSVGETHMDQARLLDQLFPGDEAAKTAASQLRGLIDRKNTVEYESRRAIEDDAIRATRRAERLVGWARSVLSP